MIHTAPTLRTPRALLRAHVRADFEPFARISADPGVTRFIGGRPFTRTESWTRFLRNPGLWEFLGYGYWAIEDPADGSYLGLVGLADFERGIPMIAGVPEAGWVLARHAEGRGLASEVVAAVIGWADDVLGAAETCCIIDPAHAASKRVAHKNGFVSRGLAAFGGGETEILWRMRE